MPIGSVVGSVRPVPHPIRPWELWHPAPEPSHLHQDDSEERLAWRDVSDEGDVAGTPVHDLAPGSLDLMPGPIGDPWEARDPAITPRPPEDLGSLMATDSGVDPGSAGRGSGERFTFGQLRPYETSTEDDLEPGPGQAPAADHDPHGGPVPENENTEPDPPTSLSSLISGPVRRRSSRPPGRRRRRLPPP